MTIYEIFISIIDKPDIINNYRKLKQFYEKHALIYEASVIDYLIERKFKKNNDSPNNSDISSES